MCIPLFIRINSLAKQGLSLPQGPQYGEASVIQRSRGLLFQSVCTPGTHPELTGSKHHQPSSSQDPPSQSNGWLPAPASVFVIIWQRLSEGSKSGFRNQSVTWRPRAGTCGATLEPS